MMRFSNQIWGKFLNALAWSCVLACLAQIELADAKCTRGKKASEIICMWPGDECCWMKQWITQNGKEVWNGGYRCIDENLELDPATESGINLGTMKYVRKKAAKDWCRIEEDYGQKIIIYTPNTGHVLYSQCQCETTGGIIILFILCLIVFLAFFVGIILGCIFCYKKQYKVTKADNVRDSWADPNQQALYDAEQLRKEEEMRRQRNGQNPPQTTNNNGDVRVIIKQKVIIPGGGGQGQLPIYQQPGQGTYQNNPNMNMQPMGGEMIPGGFGYVQPQNSIRPPNNRGDFDPNTNGVTVPRY